MVLVNDPIKRPYKNVDYNIYDIYISLSIIYTVNRTSNRLLVNLISQFQILRVCYLFFLAIFIPFVFIKD